MSETSIEWTHPPGFKGATWNPVVGCRRISPGCEHCYAETMAGRLARMGQARYLDVVKRDDNGQPRGRWNGTFREVPEVLDLPLRTKRPTCYFVNSMSDLFGEGVSDEWIAAAFGVMAATPQHRYQVLTKRAERMAGWFAGERANLDEIQEQADGYFWTHGDHVVEERRTRPPLAHGAAWPLPNVAIGVSVEDQPRAGERIPHLLRVPADVRFLSVEPQIGPVDLSRWLGATTDWTRAGGPGECTHGYAAGIRCPTCTPLLSWVIVGGESGPGARPFDVAWARSLIAQCKAAGAACFVKQLGANVITRNDDGLSGDGPNGWPLRDPLAQVEHDLDGTRDGYQGAPVRVHLDSRKGGDPSEWPADLRVRQWPEAWR